MKLTKRQLKRIIREEYSRLKRRGLIKESAYDLGSAEFSAVAMGLGGIEGKRNHFKLSKLYDTIEQMLYRDMSAQEIADSLSDEEYLLLDDLREVLSACSHHECRDMLNIAENM